MSADDRIWSPDGGLPRASGTGPAADAARMTRVRADFLEFYDRQFPYIVRFLIYVGANPQDAENATQEAFIDAWHLTAPPGKWADIEQPDGWIRTVALRKCWRNSRMILPVADSQEMPQPDSDHGELTPQTLAVLDALHSLDLEARAVMAFHMDGFTSVEIAVLLDITDQRARDLLKKARKILRKTLADTLPGNMEDKRRRTQ